MCLGIPGQVIEVVDHDAHLAKVEVGNVRRTVNVGLLAEEGVAPGDWVLVHVGFAISMIDEDEAAQTLELLGEIGQAYEDELVALMESSIE